MKPKNLHHHSDQYYLQLIISMEENKPALSTILLVLLCTNLFLLLFSGPKPLLGPKPSAAFDPTHLLLSRLSTMLTVYLSSLPFSEHGPSLRTLLRRVQQTWHRPALTLLCVELYYTAPASLLLMLKSLAKAASGAAATEAAVILGSVSCMLWLAPVIFAHSEIACKMSVVMSVVGMEAVRKAGEMLGGRKVRLQGFVLTVAMAAAERAAEGLGVVGVVLVRLVVWFVYTGFYYECKRRGDIKMGGLP